MIAWILLLFSVAAAQPPMEVFDSFTAKTNLYTWKDSLLQPLQGISGELIVDGPGNRLMIHGELQLAPFGVTRVESVVYINEGVSFTYVEALGACHAEHLPLKFNLTSVIETLREGAEYKGEELVPFDKRSQTPHYKFVSQI